MANLASRLRERKGRSEMMGRMMEETREFATAVKEAARLGCELVWFIHVFFVIEMYIHQSDGYFEHVVA